jgi:heterodisulfide reductase subunit B
MSNYMYYPGCSMEGSGRSYRESIAGICEPLGLSLVEIEDWNCCGATEYVGVSLSPAYSLIARNLAIAARTKQESEPLVAACSACYLNLAKADAYMKERPQLNDHVNEALSAGGLHYDAGTVEVRHLLEVIMNDVGLDKVRDPDHRWKNHERPDDLDRLLAALGADVVDFPLKTECCGGHMTQIAPGVGLELIKRLVDEAEHDGADMMVTVCPMCQINIDAYQGEMNAKYHTRHKMPIVFFTQLMGIAFGLEPKAVGIGREVTDARRALQRIGRPLEPAPKEEPAHRPRPDKRALPMPRMKTDSPEGEPETVEVAR